MVGSVNRVAAIEGPQRPAGQAHQSAPPHGSADSNETVHGAGRGPEPDDASPLAASERLGYAKLSQISSVLTTLASARTSQRDVAAFALQEAERKLRRLKAEALAAVVSGDRKAAALIAQDLAKVAREIADIARDYAAAGGESGFTAASLADAAAAIDVGDTASGQETITSETPQATSSAPADDPDTAAAQSRAAAGDPSTASPHPTADDAEQPRSLPEDEAYPGSLLRHGAGGEGDDTFEADARKLLEEAAASKRAMERVLYGQPVLPDATSPVIETRSALQTGLTTLVARPNAPSRVRAWRA
ncbi:hypothetical protein MKL09_11340 [Methylobacterium sp. J-048]|uniref:hypothetical protein n=1 Tax=Methylobacterium sp. J-048 TaxID=2836635 RepID=UPI001FBBD7E2|nr:hypothetical protein [Methylobacterium sp. J-048]MCJ2057148.1 hypothetical protein [Methylobacterium sp. J-048]